MSVGVRFGSGRPMICWQSRLTSREDAGGTLEDDGDAGAVRRGGPGGKGRDGESCESSGTSEIFISCLKLAQP